MGFTTKFQVMVHWKNVENNKTDFKTPFFSTVHYYYNLYLQITNSHQTLCLTK